MDKFGQYKLKLTDKNKELVRTYLQKMKKFVEKNNIELELYNDIEEMVFEKLSNQKKLDQLIITKILKEVGEPEVIFADYIPVSDDFLENSRHFKGEKNAKNTKNDDNLSYHEKLIKDGWIRDNDNAIIYGISGTLSEKLDIPIWIVRLLFVILLFLGGIGAIIYFIFGVALPIKGINYEGENFWKIQIFRSFIDFFSNIFSSLKKLFNIIFGEELKISTDNKIVEEKSNNKTVEEETKIEEKPKQKTFLGKIFSFFAYIVIFIFNILISILKTIMKYVLPTLRFIIFTIISLILFGLFIAFLAFLALSFSSFTIQNIDYTSILPEYAKWGFLAGTISTLIFLIASVNAIFNSKGINKYVILGGFITFVIMLFFAFTTSISLFNTYGQVNYYTQEAQIELDNNKDIVFNSSTSFNEEDIFLFNFGGNWTSLESITGTTLKVEIEYKFLGNDYIENTFKNAIFNPELVKNGSTIEFKDTNMLSSKVIPYILFIERHTIVYVPEGYTIKFDGYLPFIVNTDVIFEDERYENFNRVGNCVGRKMWYSAEKGTFVCLATESEVNDAKKGYLINYVIENFDSISPVTHKNIYKRDYTQHYSNISVTSDWNFWYSDWRDKDTLEIKFSDMSLTINASLDIIETDTGATVSDFRINSVGVDEGYFDEKYYNNIGAIAEWLGIGYEESFSEIINNISEGNIEGYSEITNSVSSGNILTEDENSISPIY